MKKSKLKNIIKKIIKEIKESRSIFGSSVYRKYIDQMKRKTKSRKKT